MLFLGKVKFRLIHPADIKISGLQSLNLDINSGNAVRICLRPWFASLGRAGKELCGNQSCFPVRKILFSLARSSVDLGTTSRSLLAANFPELGSLQCLKHSVVCVGCSLSLHPSKAGSLCQLPADEGLLCVPAADPSSSRRPAQKPPRAAAPEELALLQPQAPGTEMVPLHRQPREL